MPRPQFAYTICICKLRVSGPSFLTRTPSWPWPPRRLNRRTPIGRPRNPARRATISAVTPNPAVNRCLSTGRGGYGARCTGGIAGVGPGLTFHTVVDIDAVIVGIAVIAQVAGVGVIRIVDAVAVIVNIGDIVFIYRFVKL